MKRFLHFITINIFALVITSAFTFGQALDDYRTHQTGNWEDINTWEKYDGENWVYPAPEYPQYNTGGAVTVLNGHVVTVNTGGFYTHLTTINFGGQVIIAATKTLNIANDGTSAVDLQVNGTLTVNGTLGTNGSNTINISGTLYNGGTVSINNSGDVVTFENGSTYQHAINGGTLPTATWNTGSTCLITGTTSATTVTGITTSTFYNFTYNCTGQTSTFAPNPNDGWTVNGNVTFASTGSGAYRFVNMSSGQTKNIYIGGNLTVNGGSLQATGSGADTAAKVIINIGGNVSVTGGTWSLNNSSNLYTEWKIGGNISITGGTLTSGTSGTQLRRTIDFVGGTTQSFTVTSPGTISTNERTTFKVSNGSIVNLGFAFTLPTNSRIVLNKGKFVTTSSNIITIASNGVLVGGGDTTYIDGPLALQVAATSATKIFPIGKGSSYRPVTLALTHDATTNTTYTAEITNATPPERTLPSTLDSVSSVRYCTITKGSGANLTAAQITLSYGSDDNVVNKDSIRVAVDSANTGWVNLGGSGTANTTGTITSNLFTNAMSKFVIAYVKSSAPVYVPTVTTSSITDISTTFATGGGNVSNDGGAAVTARGVCWNTTGSPTTADNFTSNGTGTGSFSSSITGLSAGVTYYVRAYATNSIGTSYGNEVSFTTLAVLTVPTVVTNAVTNIVNKSATGNGNVTAWGGSTVTSRGVCWSTHHNPTLADEYTANGSGTGVFTAAIGGLSLSTTYYVRAYATNSTGTGYGDEVSFTTADPQPDSNIVVDWNGTGDYTTVQAAFNAVPANYTGTTKIFVKNGTYTEKLLLASNKINVVLEGESRDNTILTYNDYAGISGGTSTSYSVAIDASDFIAKNITIRNTHAASAGSSNEQAVALRANGDRQQYVNCKILGYQDTYYTWGGSGTGRLYHKNCYIEGSVDFIFGRDIAVFDSCTININRNGGTLTAASTDATSQYGYVFRNCTITADETGYDGATITSFYLGRPWQANPRTVFLNCYEPSTLHSAGWTTFSATAELYAEYNCYGPGASTNRGIIWASTSQPSQLTETQANNYTLSNIFSKNSASGLSSNWIPSESAGDAVPLPVELAAFNVTTKGNSVVLNWKTATELNNVGFEIERKKNIANQWSKIGFVEGSGTSNSSKEYSFTDSKLAVGKYQYRLKQIDRNGSFKYSATIEVVVLSAPKSFNLEQNFPNPFNPTTNIIYDIPVESKVSLKIYDVLGKEIAVLVNEKQSAGSYTISFDAAALPSGVYFYSIKTESFSSTKKMILTK